MIKHNQAYAGVAIFLDIAREHMTELAVLFEEDENGHDQATVEDMRQELDSLMRSWKKLPENLIGGDLK